MFMVGSCVGFLIGSVVISVLLLGFLAESAMADACPLVPPCTFGSRADLFYWRYCFASGTRQVVRFGTAPRSFGTDPVLRQRAIRDVQHLLSARISGQEEVLNRLFPLIRQKLYHPYSPMVLHFVGDNGVGKTHTALLLSQALSLHCALNGNAKMNGVCKKGNNLLHISGSSYSDLSSVEKSRQHIIHLIHQHQLQFPYGIVLLDDVTEFPAPLLQGLHPLFGRAENFGADTPQGTPSLNQLLIILTSDLGREGRTAGMGYTAIENLAERELKELYGNIGSFTKHLYFEPLDRLKAEQLIEKWMRYLPCRMQAMGCALESVELSSEALEWVLHTTKWEEGENGRSVEDGLQALVPLLVQYLEVNGKDRPMKAEFTLNRKKNSIEVRNQRVDNFNEDM